MSFLLQNFITKYKLDGINLNTFCQFQRIFTFNDSNIMKQTL